MFVILLSVSFTVNEDVARCCVEGALSSLMWLRGTPDVDVEFAENEEAVSATQLSAQSSLSIFDLMRDTRVLKPLLLSIALMFFQQMSGINAVIFYTSHIFESAGFGSNPNLPTMIVGAVLVVATFVSTVIADVAGRRVLLLTSGVAMTTSIATLGVYFYVTEQHQVSLSVCLSVYVRIY